MDQILHSDYYPIIQIRYLTFQSWIARPKNQLKFSSGNTGVDAYTGQQLGFFLCLKGFVRYYLT